MAIKSNFPDRLQVRLSSSAELIRASLEPYIPWIEEMMGAPLDQTLTLEVDGEPGNAVAERLLPGLPLSARTKSRNRSWHSLIEEWALPGGGSPRIAASLLRERRPKTAPATVWELEWQEIPIALKLRGLPRRVVSVNLPVVFPPSELPILESSRHWLIVHRQDAAALLLMIQQVQNKAERTLRTVSGAIRLEGRYDWDTLVLDPTVSRMVRRDFELFFEREEWFRKHNLPYRRGYLLYGSPGNGKTAAIRVMAAHPHIKPYALDLSDGDNQSSQLVALFEQAARNTPALVILEDLDRAFPTEGKRTRERSVSFQTLLNCLDGVATKDGVITVATANTPECLDPAIIKRPGRFDRVVRFRNPDANLRRQYYLRLNPILTGDEFEVAIEKTDGFSFAHLRETYITGAQSAFERARDVTVAHIVEAIDLQVGGAQELKAASGAAPGFVSTHLSKPDSSSFGGSSG
jgi:ATPase family protein associated with various cellular activities (AAA)